MIFSKLLDIRYGICQQYLRDNDDLFYRTIARKTLVRNAWNLKKKNKIHKYICNLGKLKQVNYKFNNFDCDMQKWTRNKENILTWDETDMKTQKKFWQYITIQISGSCCCFLYQIKTWDWLIYSFNACWCLMDGSVDNETHLLRVGGGGGYSF